MAQRVFSGMLNDIFKESGVDSKKCYVFSDDEGKKNLYIPKYCKLNQMNYSVITKQTLLNIFILFNYINIHTYMYLFLFAYC